MRITSHIQESLRQLLHAKLRSFLAVLGILVGTASVVAMVSIGQLAENQILSQYRQLGINLLSITAYATQQNQNMNPYAVITLAKTNDLKKVDPNIIELAPYITSYGNIIFRGQSVEGSTVGVSASIQAIAKLQLAAGRFISFLDGRNQYCVIGSSIAKNIGLTPQETLGKQIRIGQTIFTIVGVLKKWPENFFFSTDFNQSILIPIESALAIRKSIAINNIALQLKNASEESATAKKVKNYLQNHTTNLQIDIHSPQSLIKSMESSSNTMTLLLGLIGSISLLVGGIGVMNIMLVSVSERHREIGIRLAIGACQRDIQLQFLIEAGSLSLFGGIGGMIIGIIATYIVSLYSHWTFSFLLWPPMLGGAVSTLTGIFFGFYPAYKASKLDPISTLRSE